EHAGGRDAPGLRAARAAPLCRQAQALGGCALTEYVGGYGKTTRSNPAATSVPTTTHGWSARLPRFRGAGFAHLRSYDAANFSSLIASKSCTPPPTRLVV